MKRSLFVMSSALIALGYVSFASAAALTTTCQDPVIDVVDGAGNHHTQPAPGQNVTIEVSVDDDWSKANFTMNTVGIPLDLPCNSPKEAGKDFVCQAALKDDENSINNMLFSFVVDAQDKMSFHTKGSVFGFDVELVYSCAAQK